MADAMARPAKVCSRPPASRGGSSEVLGIRGQIDQRPDKRFRGRASRISDLSTACAC